MSLDLTDEEWNECYNAYLDEYRNSAGKDSDQLHLRIMLKNIGVDHDEIEYIIRTTNTR